MVVDIGGVRQGVSDLLQADYTKPLGICCGFSTVMKFWIPQFGRTGPLSRCLRGVRWGVSDFLQIALQSHWVSAMVLPPCLIYFLLPQFRGKGCPYEVDDGTVG